MRIEATYGRAEDKPKQAELTLETRLNTELDRWIVVGVALRNKRTEGDTGRDVFLLRIKQRKPL